MEKHTYTKKFKGEFKFFVYLELDEYDNIPYFCRIFEEYIYFCY